SGGRRRGEPRRPGRPRRFLPSPRRARCRRSARTGRRTRAAGRTDRQPERIQPPDGHPPKTPVIATNERRHLLGDWSERAESRRLEERRGFPGRADVLAAELGDDPPARRALEEAELEQVRLVDILDRLGLLAERDRERREPDRAAAELLHDRAQ